MADKKEDKKTPEVALSPLEKRLDILEKALKELVDLPGQVERLETQVETLKKAKPADLPDLGTLLEDVQRLKKFTKLPKRT